MNANKEGFGLIFSGEQKTSFNLFNYNIMTLKFLYSNTLSYLNEINGRIGNFLIPLLNGFELFEIKK